MIIIPTTFIAHRQVSGTVWDQAWVWAAAGPAVAGIESWLGHRSPARPLAWRRRVLGGVALAVSFSIIASAGIARGIAAAFSTERTHHERRQDRRQHRLSD